MCLWFATSSVQMEMYQTTPIQHMDIQSYHKNVLKFQSEYAKILLPYIHVYILEVAICYK